MFRTTVRVGLILLVIIAAAALEAQEPPLIRGSGARDGCDLLCLTEADNGRTVHLRQGTLMQVSLVGNPSTGAWWHVEALDTGVLQPLCEAFTSFRPDLVGSSGRIHGFYQAAQQGRTELSLLYYRSWEGPATATADFTVTVVVH